MKADLSEANLHCATLDDVNLLGIRWHNTRLDNLDTGKRLMQERRGRKERDPVQARIWLKEAEETYRDLRKASEAQGIFTMSGRYIQQELTMRRLQLPFWSSQRFTSWIVDLFCGYGEAPCGWYSSPAAHLHLQHLLLLLWPELQRQPPDLPARRPF